MAEVLITMVLGFMMLSLLYEITATALKRLGYFDRRLDVDMVVSQVMKNLKLDLIGSSPDGTANVSGNGWNGIAISIQGPVSESGDRNWLDLPVYYGVNEDSSRLVRCWKKAGPSLLEEPSSSNGDFVAAIQGNGWSQSSYPGIRKLKIENEEGSLKVSLDYSMPQSNGSSRVQTSTMLLSYRL